MQNRELARAKGKRTCEMLSGLVLILEELFIVKTSPREPPGDIEKEVASSEVQV